MANFKREDFKYDDTKLRALQEPITIHLAKLEAGREMPITLPPKEGFPPGQGLTYEEATRIHDVALNLSGGGDYRALATDASGNKYEWRFYFPPQKFPEVRTSAAPPAPAAVQPIQPPMPWAPQPPQPSAWLGMHGGPVVPSLGPQPMPQQPYGAPPYGWNPFAYIPQPTPAPKQDTAAHALELQLIQERSRNELTAMEARHRQDMATLMNEIKAIAAKPTGPSEAERELRAELARLREKSEQNQMMAMMMQMMQTMAAPKGMDPAMQLVLESVKAQAEAQKEAARLQAEASREAARSAMTPRDMFEMAERARASTGVDVVMPKVHEMYSNMVSTLQRSFEAINNLSPQGPHPAVEMVGQALTGIQTNVQQYLEGKNMEKSGEAQYKAAQAQAEVERARAEQMRIQAEYEEKQRALGHAPAAPAPTPVATEVVEEKARFTETPNRRESRGERDMRLFGPLITHVAKFREAAKLGYTETDMPDGTKKREAFTPGKAASAIFQAYAQVQEKGIGELVPGFKALEQMLMSQFVDELLPDGPLVFADEVLGEINKIAPRYISTIDAADGRGGKVHVLRIPPGAPPIAVATPVEPEDEDEEDDEDDEQEEAPPPAAASAKSAKKAR